RSTVDVTQAVLDDFAYDVLASIANNQIPPRTTAGEVPQYVDPIGGKLGRQQHVVVAELSLQGIQCGPDLVGPDARLPKAVQHMRLGERDEGDREIVL